MHQRLVPVKANDSLQPTVLALRARPAALGLHSKNRGWYVTKRIASLLVVTFVLSGCGSAPKRFYPGAAKPASDIAIVNDACKEPARALIKAATGISVSVMSGPTVHSVDGATGTSSLGPDLNVHNSAWDGSFNLHLLPGEHELIVSPNFYRAAERPRLSIRFEALAGHEYCLVRVLDSGTSTFRWQPLLVDQTNNKLLFPDSPWKVE